MVDSALKAAADLVEVFCLVLLSSPRAALLPSCTLCDVKETTFS